MDFREFINARPKVFAIAGLGIVAVVGIFAVYRATSEGGSRAVADGRAYFSVDDGKTWFADSITRPSPFVKDGKQAYRVFVWKSPGSEPYVSHLVRADNGAQGVGGELTPGIRQSRTAQAGAMEVKRPGETTWTPAESPEGRAIARPRTTSGAGDPELLEP
jgi:hypothetical protein